jgi:hypothetical protein
MRLTQKTLTATSSSATLPSTATTTRANKQELTPAQIQEFIQASLLEHKRKVKSLNSSQVKVGQKVVT